MSSGAVVAWNTIPVRNAITNGVAGYLLSPYDIGEVAEKIMARNYLAVPITVA